MLSLPSEYILYQNYPNPFNPATTISYQIPEISFITLKVYDILGIEIKSLVEKVQTVGYYDVEFIANDLPSGVYFYVLTAVAENGKRIKTSNKMILLK